MSLLISRLLFTAFILAATYFALVKVWTRKVDITALFKSPSEVIPVTDELRQGIVVNPEKIEMASTDWSTTRVVEMRNASPTDPAYSIWIKIWSDSGNWSPEKTEILPQMGDEFLSDDTLGVSTSFDLAKIIATDAQGKACICLLLYRLGPLESRLVKMKFSATTASSPGHVLLSLSSVGHASEPAPLASQDDKLAIQIRPPESLQVRSIAFLMKRGR